MPECKDNAQLTNESNQQESCSTLGWPIPILLPESIKQTQKASNSYEKLQIPLKGTINPKIEKLSSNHG